MAVDPRRSLPAVERVLQALHRESDLPPALVTEAARAAVDEARRLVELGATVNTEDVVTSARRLLDARRTAQLRSVVNATGVLLHTNLGRAPIGRDALHAATEIGGGYSNLEYRLDVGARGSRHDHAGSLLAHAVGSEAGLVVNNNAAAVLLVLATLARNREVVVSRGELVEIGGGFRVPEIIRESGCRLVEVGTTNRTRVADYERALGDDVALLLKVHASNYRMVGFTEQAAIEDLARLGPPVVLDAGSGLLDETTPWLEHRPAWLSGEPGVKQAIASGAALVTFSGDKLLGGPQAGIVVGRRELVERVARHPLARAFRADKLTLAAMQSVALSYLAGDAGAIPVWRMAATPVDALRTRAEQVARAVPGAKVVDTDAAAGGGSLPGLVIPSAGVAIETARVDEMLRSLRDQGIVARAQAGAVVCDLRTVDREDDERLARALHDARPEEA
ncbi:MAG: L-seryl-tRNA(Sec) selenium transferase [Actinobacteria bacterium]|nr:L-seryl-tRNA(Sec) selenium transferase [Actinomycetota bacterium]